MYYSLAPWVAITTTNNKTHLPALNTGTFTVCFLAGLQQYYANPGCACFAFFFLFAHDSSLREQGAEAQEGARQWAAQPMAVSVGAAGAESGAGRTKGRVTTGTMRGTEPQQQTPNASDCRLRSVMLSACLHQAFGCGILTFPLLQQNTPCMASWGGDCSHQRGTFGLYQHKCFLPLLQILS